MKRRFYQILFLLLVLTINQARAQKVRVYVNSENISTDDQLVLTVELINASGQIPRPSFPEIEAFVRRGSSTNQTLTPAGRTISFSQTYLPQRTGSFRLPSFRYSLNGKTYKLATKSVRVKKGTGRKKQPSNGSGNPFSDFFKDPFEDFFRGSGSGNGQQQKKDLQFQETDADYFMSVNLNKDSCYIGEQVVGEIVLYINERDRGKINVDANAIVEMQQRIKNSGFWQEIYDFKYVPTNQVEIRGKRYIAYTLYRTHLFPLSSGEIAFKDLYLDARKLFVATNASIRQQWLGQNTKFEPIRVKAAPRKLYVKPLPPTNLPNASMVGKFKMEGGLNTKELNTGEVLELELDIQSTGNTAMMPPPTINFPESFDVDAPNSSMETKIKEKGYFGKKKFNYYLVPTRNGSYDIGPIRFYYFDPVRKAYDSLTVNNIPIRVNGEDLKNLKLKQNGEDQFYKSVVDEAKIGLRRDSEHRGWYLLGPFLLLGGALTYHFMRKRKQGSRDTQESGPVNPLD